MTTPTAASTIFVRPSPTYAYPIQIEHQSLPKLGEFCKSLKLGHKILILSHEKLAPYTQKIEESCKAKGFLPIIWTVPPGEPSKSIETVMAILACLIEHKFERIDSLIAVGGGVIGDLGGFAASLYLRGIRYIQVPTSLLAQVDASIGGKTGVNHPLGKNLIGTFYQPLAVWIDPSCLKTLSKRELKCGLAEIVKYGVIGDPKLFRYLDTHWEPLRAAEYTPETEAIWRHIIQESCRQKADVVSKDEKEAALREILNFGHTIGHAIEAVFQYQDYAHGEAVALGMAAATRMAQRLQMISDTDSHRILTLLNHLNFALTLPQCDKRLLLEKLTLDKKVRDGKIRFVLPTQIGEVQVREDIPMSLIESVITEMISA